ncbi:MAG TPA: NFACT family protein, partial [Spirochaetia bacterium]|nr:NFACT family protein [Spirochaetia bacterium]
MSLNWKEIDCILSELDLTGSHIQRIVQPDFASLVFSIYRPGDPFDLFISLESGKTRLHRLNEELKTPQKLQRFSQFLRARCKGARIEAAYQVHGDRIVKLVVSAAEVQTLLWIRLWGGAANIIATDPHGTILDAFYRRPGRGEVSGGIYDPEAASDSASKSSSSKTYEIRELPGSGSFNERVESFYLETAPRADIETLRIEALAAVEKRETRLMGALETLERQRLVNRNAERYRELGDLIMSNLHGIHEGEDRVAVESYYDENKVIQIELDPTLRPEQNAEDYYDRYKKAKSGSQKLAEEISQLEDELESVRRQRREILDSGDVKALARIGARSKASRGTKAKESPIGLQFQSGPHRIIVGRSAAENDTLLRKH